MTRALAIDPGGCVGWARTDGECGEWVIVPPRAVMTRLEVGAALKVYRHSLSDMLAEFKPAYLIVERTIQGARFVMDYTIAAEWIAIEAADLYECRLAQMTAGHVRRTWWKPGTKAKDRMHVAKARDLGFIPLSDHAADAALLLTAWQQKIRENAE